jgi:hypothetical protein
MVVLNSYSYSYTDRLSWGARGHHREIEPSGYCGAPTGSSFRSFSSRALREKGVRLAQNIQIGPCITVGIQL